MALTPWCNGPIIFRIGFKNVNMIFFKNTNKPSNLLHSLFALETKNNTFIIPVGLILYYHSIWWGQGLLQVCLYCDYRVDLNSSLVIITVLFTRRLSKTPLIIPDSYQVNHYFHHTSKLSRIKNCSKCKERWRIVVVGGYKDSIFATTTAISDWMCLENFDMRFDCPNFLEHFIRSWCKDHSMHANFYGIIQLEVVISAIFSTNIEHTRILYSLGKWTFSHDCNEALSVYLLIAS